MTQTEKTILFYASLTKKGHLTLFNSFNKLKHRGVRAFKEVTYVTSKKKLCTKKSYTDDNGGFFLKSDIKKISIELNIGYETFRKQISKMQSLGWLIKTTTGYRLIGKKKLFNQYVNGMNRLCFYADNNNEIHKLCAIRFLKVNYYQQLHITLGRPKRRHKYSRAFLRSKDYSVSVRKLQNILGFKSAMSASKFIQILEKEHLITIAKRNEMLCTTAEFKYYLKSNKSLIDRCFSKDGIIYERKCNNINIVW